MTRFPFFGAHRLGRDRVNDIGLLRVVEHPQVLAQGHQSRQLVVHLDAERAKPAAPYCE